MKVFVLLVGLAVLVLSGHLLWDETRSRRLRISAAAMLGIVMSVLGLLVGLSFGDAAMSFERHERDISFAAAKQAAERQRCDLIEIAYQAYLDGSKTQKGDLHALREFTAAIQKGLN